MASDFNDAATPRFPSEVVIIPASETTPEIYVCPSGDLSAAATLLTLSFLPEELMAPLVKRGTKIICSETYGIEYQRVADNLHGDLPASLKNPDSETNIKLRNFRAGNYVYSNILGVFEESQEAQTARTIRKAGGRQNASTNILAAIFGNDESDEDDIEQLHEDANTLLLDETHEDPRNFWTHKAPIKLTDVLTHFTDLDRRKELMQKLTVIIPERAAAHLIPKSLAHEIGHSNRAMMLLLPDPACPEDAEIRTFHAALPTMVLSSTFLNPELESSKTHPKAPKLAYYLNDRNEAQAELIGTALIERVNLEHGLQIPTSDLHEVLPKTYAEIKRRVNANLDKMRNDKTYLRKIRNPKPEHSSKSLDAYADFLEEHGLEFS